MRGAGVIAFAYDVDRAIEASTGRIRSSFGPTQRLIADKMIADHYDAGSTAKETAQVVWAALKSLEE